MKRLLWYLCNGYYDPCLKAHANVSILILEGDAEWDEAYARWISGKNPTDSPDWKQGVILSRTSATVTGWSYR